MLPYVELLISLAAHGADPVKVSDVREILKSSCFDCHSAGQSEGGFSLDSLTALHDSGVKQLTEEEKEKWFVVLRKVQSRTMPPPGEEPLPQAARSLLADWIKYSAFAIDPQHPDPGHVTLRRLNQVEYRNTVRDLVGVEYNTTANFPADDTGHGFDNIGEVLSMSPLLLEKYVNAAEEIVSSAVPVVSGVVRVRVLSGTEFGRTTQVVNSGEAGSQSPSPRTDSGQRRTSPRGFEMSYYESASANARLDVDITGNYTLRLNLAASETYVDNQFDENRCEFTFAIDGQTLLTETMVRQGSKDYQFDFNMPIEKGPHQLTVSVKPLSSSPQIRQLRLLIKSVETVGPHDVAHFVKPERYDEFFPRSVPTTDDEQRLYARQLLEPFASRAFRRPVDEDSLSRLVVLAESVYLRGGTFEAGIAKAMTAVLASPRFLFREEAVYANSDETFPYVDEYALATRLSYFLWSTMPDVELMNLASSGELRSQLDWQVARMLKDPRSQALSENFVGQWLRARAVEHIQINSPAVLSREPQRSDPEADIRRRRFFELFRLGELRSDEEEREYEGEKEKFLSSFGDSTRSELTAELRLAMRREAEMLFDHVVKENRSLLDLIDCDYTFMNEALWGHYQIADLDPIRGPEMRLVKLPANSHRGGVLTLGSTLVVTSNPDRTSPVKRGLFVLENLLGTPPAAPPPNIPALEDAVSDKGQPPSLRETLAIHRANALCSSCHNQMDPLGLSLENFNALGMYRARELNQEIDASGELVSGESFSTIEELKKILAQEHRQDFYRCISEKLMTYALGRAVQYSDTHTLDQLVSDLQATDGAAQSLIYGIVHSSAFQRIRNKSSAN